jgi:hypothetical protein
MKPQSTHPVSSILIGGGLAAALDITYAILRYNPSNPLSVLQSVAAGWLGRDAMQTGWAGGALGLASHFVILITAATVYYAASRKVAFMRSNWILSGAVLGREAQSLGVSR